MLNYYLGLTCLSWRNEQNSENMKMLLFAELHFFVNVSQAFVDNLLY